MWWCRCVNPIKSRFNNMIINNGSSCSIVMCMQCACVYALIQLTQEMAFLIKCDNPPFPFGKDRFECVKECFKLLFALRNFLESKQMGASVNRSEEHTSELKSLM